MIVYSLHLVLWYFIKQWRLAKHLTPWPRSITNMWRGEKKGGRLDPLPKIFGSDLANQIVNLAVIFQIIICVNDLHNSPGSKEKKKTCLFHCTFCAKYYMKCYLLARTILLFWTTGHNFFKPHNIHYHSYNFTLIWLHVFECRVSLDL